MASHRHRAGQHSWQPGPWVSAIHPDTPSSMMLVCECGELRRVPLPSIKRLRRPVVPKIDLDLMEQLILAWGPEREPGAARRVAQRLADIALYGEPDTGEPR